MKRVITTMLSMMISFWGIAQTTWYNQNSGTNKQLSDVCFIDQNNGWVCGWTGTMLHTTDGGATWIPQTVPPNNAYYSVSFTDANNGWACGYSGKIIHTSDGGENWALQNSPTTYYLNSIFFVDSLQGWAAGGTSGTFPSYIHTRIILNTTNGGATWNTQYVQSYEDVLYSISFVDDMNGFATGEGGVFMHTTNGGINWDVQTVNASFRFFDVNFINGSTGWICGEYLGLPHYASVFKTTNGGTMWTAEPLGTDETMQGIYFTNELNGWTVGNNNSTDGVIYHTTDGGANWSSVSAPGILSLSRVFFANEMRGWVVGYQGTIASTFAGFDVGLRVYLEGPFENSIMGTQLNQADEIPLNQPYNISPWNYAGTESVTAIPNTDVVDWVLVELRDATSAAAATQSTRVARQAAFLLKDGTIRGLDGLSDLHFTVGITNDLYVIVWHRNHLPILSANALILNGGVYSYDFTTDMNKVYGGSAGYKAIGTSAYGMVGGDQNADGHITYSDYALWLSIAGRQGYYASDFNMDQQVDNKDKNDIWRLNTSLSSQVPN